MIETYKIIIGVYDRDVTTGLFNLRIDSNTSSIRSSRRGADLRQKTFNFLCE